MFESAGAAEELQRLKEKLKEKEEQVQQAAQAGLNLLNQQMELQTKLEEQRAEMTNVIEALEQDKYSLQTELKLKTRMLESLQSDYDCVKNQQKEQLQQQEEHLERSHNMQVNDLKNKVMSLQSELEECQLNEKFLKHELEIQTETLNQKMEELRALNEKTQDTMSSEVMELQLKSMELENAKVDLEHSLREAQHREQYLELTTTGLKRQLQRTKEEMEERQREAVSWFNALEKSREVNQDLQIQLDQVLQQAQDPNSKGNSLFAELEDKRAEMERQLISMKVQYQSLQKQHAFSKQQLHSMKVQIATLMQLQGSRADPAQLERLQSMLSEKNGEIQNLMTKLQNQEKVVMMLKSQPSCPPPGDREDIQDETYYTDLLRMKLNNSVKDAERLGDELSLQRMKSLSESQRALELERKLFLAERLSKQAQSEKIKLQLQIEELKHKYEVNEITKNSTLKRKREKLPGDIIHSSEATMATKSTLEINLAHCRTAETKADGQHIPNNQPDAVPHQHNSPIKPLSIKEALLPDHQPAMAVADCEEPPVKKPSAPLQSPVTNNDENKRGDKWRKKEQHKTMENTKTEVEERVGRGGGGRKQRTEEMIHVSGKNSMESQCAQQ
ncbi:protein Spindly [Lampris incognitus]|uniref:protein Spindly n=1 Tax=Lampris incognitus TaxID=2546036 RepID=UPI0024B4CD5F|nr:protein Spindly [Lampris incognitus]